VAAVTGSLLLVAFAGPAAACQPTDVVCAAGATADTATGAVETRGGTISNTADGASSAVGGLTDDADPTGAVDDAAPSAVSQVSQIGGAAVDVKNAVDSVADEVDHGVDPVRDGAGTISPADRPSTRLDNGDRHASGNAANEHPGSRARLPVPRPFLSRVIEREPFSGPAVGSSALRDALAAPIESLLAARGLRPELIGSSAASIAADIARRIAFPVALLLVVIGFLVVQHRIDSREPKLATAPVVTDIARFV
jgi:hypothetical protein